MPSTTEISPDPKDDAFCLCAVHGNAGFIVTLNTRDFPQDRLGAKVTVPGAIRGLSEVIATVYAMDLFVAAQVRPAFGQWSFNGSGTRRR